MGYKMSGFSGFKNSPAKQKKGKILTPDSKLRKSENPDTWVYKGMSKVEKINDLEDRISFIQEDVSEGEATPQQKKDLVGLKRELNIIRKTGNK